MLMRILAVAGFVAASHLTGCIVGCSSPTQKVATSAADILFTQADSTTYDLVMVAKQQAVDKAAADVKAAVLAANSDAAVKAVETLATTFEKIGYLDSQYTKARAGPGGIVRQYIWQQQGVFDVLLKEAEQVKSK